MKDSIEQDDLDLLLYLANELSADGRETMARRLANDAALRARLESLRSVQQAVGAHLATADRADPLDARLRGIERDVSRMLRQWKVDRAVRAAPAAGPARERQRRVPFWLYPLATAAVVLFTLGLWWLTVRQDEGAMTVVDSGIDPSSQPFYAALMPGSDDVDLGDVNDSLAALEREFARHQAIDFALQ